MSEWTQIARNIEGVGINWSGGIVGSGYLSRGYSSGESYAPGIDTFTNTSPAPYTGIGYEYNVGVDSVGPSGEYKFKRVHTLSNGQVIWDLAGNVWEFNSDNCQPGNGAGYWYNSQSSEWIEWNNLNLSDYEKSAAGPNGNYTSAENMGRYWDCRISGGVPIRGGHWYLGTNSGIYALPLVNGPSLANANVGFRCIK
jgi:hypothetical protein